jgi:hypothetical protein
MKCCVCNEYIEMCYNSKTMIQLTEQRLCFTCNHWKQIELQKHKYHIIDGNCYCILPDEPNQPLQGFGGKEFTIKTFDDQVFVTRNLWHQGEVPQHFLLSLPNTAEFIRESESLKQLLTTSETTSNNK